MQLLIASRALEKKFEAAELLVRFAANQEGSDQVEAGVKADQARVMEEFLTLLEEVSSGKKREADEPFDYYEVVIRVPKTNTTQ